MSFIVGRASPQGQAKSTGLGISPFTDSASSTYGDRLVIRSRHLDEPVRTGEIVEVHGKDGGPPYVVRWEGETDTVVIVPGPDAHVEHHTGGISSAQKAQT